MTPRASCLALPMLALFLQPALAFDCGKAKTAVENAICGSSELKALDDDLATAYANAKAELPAAQQKMLVRSQRRWIARRENCSGADENIDACVTREITDRLSLLSGMPETGPGASGHLIPHFVVQDGTPESYDVNLAVLRFAAAETPGEEKFNQVADKVLRAAKLGPHGEDSQGSIYADEEIWSLIYASPQFMSVRRDYYEDKGGAHGMYGVFNLNIDMATGKVLTLADVLTEPSAAMLALECRRQILAEKTKRFAAADMGEPDGVDGDAVLQHVKKLEFWSIGESEIVVSFDPYEVGAYAEGAYSCSFPAAEVKKLAVPGAVLP